MKNYKSYVRCILTEIKIKLYHYTSNFINNSPFWRAYNIITINTKIFFKK